MPEPAPYTALLARSHTVAARVLASVNGSTFTKRVPLAPGGRIEITGGTGQRRALSARVRAELDEAVVDPWAVEWRVEYLIASGGQQWWEPVGVFVLTTTRQDGDGFVAVTGGDRWVRVADARFVRPVSTSGDSVAALVELLTDADSRITVDTTRAPAGTHRTSLWERDRDKAVQDLARSIGAQVGFDREGVAVIEPIPSLADTVVWTIGAGAGGVKVAARPGFSTRSTYNAGVVVGAGPGDTPVYGVAYDDAAGSRTRYGGPAGKRPRFLESTLITTQSQADAAALGLRDRSLVIARDAEVDAVIHPGLDAGSVVDVEVRRGVWERHLVASYPLPIGGVAGRTTIALASTADEEDTEA